MNTKFTLNELRAIEALIYDFSARYKTLDLYWTLLIDHHIIKAKTLPCYRGNGTYARYNTLMEEETIESINAISNPSDAFEAIAIHLGGRFKNYDKGPLWVLNHPDELFKRCNNESALQFVDSSTFDVLPNQLNNVTLPNGQALDFMFIPSDTELTVLSLALEPKES
ncbi:hypothetical protein [Veillonella caviae]|uniref:hypothetical protein n=1 Tax=Veillonella caviae TaxID=248316 RepID=UPI0023549D2C|nr:hypothetical protein [Veillonella caviae]